MKLKKIAFFKITSRHNSGLPSLQDMLRYDVAFQHQERPEIIAFPIFHTKYGNLGGRITHGRWQSFGIGKMTSLGDEEARDLKFGLQAEKWTTYVHPARRNGPTDYSRYVPVSLAEYLAAKDHREIGVEGECK